MSRSQVDSNDSVDLGELAFLGDDDDDAPQKNPLYESDDFDPDRLLSQPLFQDSSGDIELNKGDDDIDSIDSLPSDDAGEFAGDHNENTLSRVSNQSNHQQSTSQQNTGSSFGQGGGNPSSPSHSSSQRHVNFQAANGSPQHGPMSNNFQLQGAHLAIQQVQQRIVQVQLDTNNISSPQHQPSQNMGDNINIQSLMDQASKNRSPPGRSVSMPIRRSQNPAGAINQPTFMMQQPMDQFQQQHQQQQHAAALGNSQGSSHSGVGSQGNMNQMHQMMNNISMDGSMHSQMNNNLGFMQTNPVDQQQGMMNSPTMNPLMNPSMCNMPMMSNIPRINQVTSLDASDRSAMENMNKITGMTNMQGMNQGFSMDSSDGTPISNMQNMNMHVMNNQGFNLDVSDRSAMNNAGMNNIGNLQRFNNTDLDISVHSMPGNMSNIPMNPSMMMMMQQQGFDMSSMNFGDNGQNASNVGMISDQLQNGMMGGGNFNLEHMQRTFQTQGLIPGPAGSSQTFQGQPSGGLSMERLVEKMQRSAMSRNLVKQLSGPGRGIPQTNSGRNLSRQHSGRGVARQSSKSGRSIARASSGKGLQRSSSARQGEVGGELPVRRLVQESKYRLQGNSLSKSLHDPRRGVNRHKSQSSAIGGNNHKPVVNVDGNSIGMF